MHIADTTGFRNSLNAMEAALALSKGGNDDLHIREARTHLEDAIQAACGLSQQVPKRNLSELITDATTKEKGRRESAILLVRALSVDGLIPFQDDRHLERRVVDLIEAGFADQCRSLKLAEKRQTFEKLNALKGLHEGICMNLRVLKELPSTFSEIDGIKPDVQKALRHDRVNAYLSPYDWTSTKGKLTHVCDQISGIVECRDATYKARFDELLVAVNALEEVAGSSPSFIDYEYVIPFAEAVKRALQAVKARAVADFSCTIDARRKPPNIAEKRYQLHQENKLLTITVPLVNNGPGVAVDLTVELDCGNDESLALDIEQIHLGDIPPGEFAVSFKALVVKPVSSVKMAMQLSWSQLFGDSQSMAFDLQLSAQDPTVNWSRLEQLDPYSLEVADSEQFVGRTAKVQAIGNRLLKNQMSSTYITGQKRVGKTSLAQAVLRYVKSQTPSTTTYETFYLEWGEYAAADATSTVRALGEQICGFLKQHLPNGTTFQPTVFEGSLAPLNALAKHLETYCPSKRFVIVLDEFDEIHPEMYRYGPLAEAFFANLRTLGARRNLAFILVGGERMPFIIGAQGDQLNKFVREPLDYFSRSDEWTDYIELVTDPVKDSLNWGESALNELFSATNGHPYYTKLICAKVFASAVAQRDTEILASDVKHAVNGRVSELDTNAFAHFWKDGINAEREEAEVIELKRQRVLVALGRTQRAGIPTRQTIAQNITGQLQANEVGPLLDDFLRRDILKDVDGQITMMLPVFQRWLHDVGVTKLITSTLADELENELQKANDAAYVKASEIEELIKSWPLFRGREVTGESVRAWLEQVPNAIEQRTLFTILQNLMFVGTPRITELIRHAHSDVARSMAPRVRSNTIEKRRDLLITYLDGPGKSGAYYARAYAKENEILLECVVEPTKVVRKLERDDDQTKALIVVDDLAGTGRTIADSIQKLLAEFNSSLIARNIPLFIVVLFATEEAERKIRGSLNQFPDVISKLHIGSLLTDINRAFPSKGIGFWPDEQSRDKAKTLCIRLGTGLFKEPLGFGSQSLLVSFPDTCPNNCLPIIFGSRQGANPWTALLPRPVS